MPLEARKIESRSPSVIHGNSISRFERRSVPYKRMAVLPSGRESLGASPEQARLRVLFLELGQELVDVADGTAIVALLGETIFPAVVDRTFFADLDPGLALDPRSFETRLRIALESEPVEDGITHPAEQIIDDALLSLNSHDALSWLRGLAIDIEQPGIAASVLRCLGRRRPATSAWRARIARDALASNDVEMRDAAVQAAEEWGDTEVQDVLRRHTEKVSWLRDYIKDVLEDLGE